MPLVAGVDSSTQSCKVVVCDAATGAVVRHGAAPHPEGTEVHPDAWWQALHAAIAAAGGWDDVAAVAVGGQQHGMVCLAEDGSVVRPALLWNDTRSAAAADALVAELGPHAWVEAVGSVPVAAFTITKLRWLAEHEPAAAARVAAVCLPHDYLTWRLRGAGDLGALVTDRSDASGTGYFDSVRNEYRRDLLQRAFGRDVLLPRVAAPAEALDAAPWLLGPGGGDNAAAGFGLGAGSDAVVSLGTSGTAFAGSDVSPHDPTGAVAGFADLTGRFLPLVCTLNAAQVLDRLRALLGASHTEFDGLALAAAPGAGGLALVPYFAGERTPNLPAATGSLLGLTLENATAENMARAAVEGVLCGMADALDALAAQGARIGQVRLVGGAARSAAVRALAPAVFAVPVVVPPAAEYVALGAARQAAWVLAGGEPPAWPEPAGAERHDAAPTPEVRARYRQAAALHLSRA